MMMMMMITIVMMMTVLYVCIYFMCTSATTDVCTPATTSTYESHHASIQMGHGSKTIRFDKRHGRRNFAVRYRIGTLPEHLRGENFPNERTLMDAVNRYVQRHHSPPAPILIILLTSLLPSYFYAGLGELSARQQYDIIRYVLHECLKPDRSR